MTMPHEYKLRPHQAECMDDFWRYMINEPGDPVIVQPTGAGKSIIAAEIAKGVASVGRKALVIAMKKELLQQNSEKLQSLAPDVNFGIYSAGMNKRNTEADVVFCGIQSVYKRAFEFGQRDLVIIDEAHTIPKADAGMYRRFFDDLKTANPTLRKVGLTATPYRLDSGLIYGEGQPFDAICHQTSIKTLLDAGYISPIESAPVTEIKTDSLHVRGGEFVLSEMQNLFDEHVIAASEETVAIANAQNRKHCLVFCTGVAHAEHVKECIETLTDEDVRLITGETLPLMRTTFLDQFKTGKVRWLINVDVLTTGFDAPNIDLISVMRPTLSPGLFYQIVGRGFRLSPGKANCLLLDFGGNLKRHGALDSKDYGKKAKNKGQGGGDAPSKECPSCQAVVAAGLRECECGWKFPPPDNASHDGQADTESLVLESQQKPVRYFVEAIAAHIHESKKSGQVMLCVVYECQPEDEEERGDLRGQIVREYVCLEHEGYARKKAAAWWRERSRTDVPETAEEALELFRAGAVAGAKFITVKQENGWPRIESAELDPIPEIDLAATWDEDDDCPF